MEKLIILEYNLQNKDDPNNADNFKTLDYLKMNENDPKNENDLKVEVSKTKLYQNILVSKQQHLPLVP